MDRHEALMILRQLRQKAADLNLKKEYAQQFLEEYMGFMEFTMIAGYATDEIRFVKVLEHKMKAWFEAMEES